MSVIVVEGSGVVSPAGWGLAAFHTALGAKAVLPAKEMARPGVATPLLVRGVPAAGRPAALNHARLRRASPVSQYAAAAALESVGWHGGAGGLRRKLGLIFCVTCGCVTYSRRFYTEALQNPGTASPLLFPETVFNAPASHICGVLETDARTYTLVGDQGTFLQGLALAAEWLDAGEMEGCVVVGADELDWLVAYGVGLMDRKIVLGEGAGALYLARGEPGGGKVALAQVSSPQLYRREQTRGPAAMKVRKEIAPENNGELLVDGWQAAWRTDAAEREAWRDWHGPRISPKRYLGEGFMASAGWQCVAAVEALRRGEHAQAIVNIVGGNEQAVAARFRVL